MAKETDIVQPKIKIKVFGIGGGGNSALGRMKADEVIDLDVVAINTDAHQLMSVAEKGLRTLQIGESLTHGRGTGGNVDVGMQAAKADEAKLRDAMAGADLLFIATAMGGGTGTGAAPVIAEIAKDAGILTVGVVTEPFSFEGRRKQCIAAQGVAKLQALLDALIVVENDSLMKLPENKNLTLTNAFQAADNVLLQAVGCIAELILKTGFVNVDFADVKTIFRHSESSDALLGTGRSKKSAVDAVQRAVASPLFSKSLEGARAVIVNLTGDENLSMFDVDEATNYVADNTDGDVDLIFGTVIDETMDGEVQATVIATDFADSEMKKSPRIGKQPEKKEEPPKSKIELEPPKFMNATKDRSGGAFAIPAFRLATDEGKTEK